MPPSELVDLQKENALLQRRLNVICELDSIRDGYEDEQLLAVSKPPGISLYPTRRHPAGSLIEHVHRLTRERGLNPTLSAPPRIGWPMAARCTRS